MAKSFKNLAPSKLRIVLLKLVVMDKHVISSNQMIVHRNKEVQWDVNIFVMVFVTERLVAAIDFPVHLTRFEVEGLEPLEEVLLEELLGQVC